MFNNNRTKLFLNNYLAKSKSGSPLPENLQFPYGELPRLAVQSLFILYECLPVLVV